MLHSLASAFNAGGPFMWVILVVFAIACAVVVDRLIFYFIICRPNGVEMVSVIAQALNGSDAQKAKSIVAKRRAPLNMLMQTAIERYAAGMSFEDIQKGIDQCYHSFIAPIDFI